MRGQEITTWKRKSRTPARKMRKMRGKPRSSARFHTAHLRAQITSRFCISPTHDSAIATPRVLSVRRWKEGRKRKREKGGWEERRKTEMKKSLLPPPPKYSSELA